MYSVKGLLRKWVDVHNKGRYWWIIDYLKSQESFQKLFYAYLQPDTDLLMCVSDRSESGHYYAEDRITPAMTTPVSILIRGLHP